MFNLPTKLSKQIIVAELIIIVFCGLFVARQILIKEFRVEEDLKTYHAFFFNMIKEHCPSLNGINVANRRFISFDEKEPRRVGSKESTKYIVATCTRSFNEFSIKINRYYWDNSDERARTTTFVHEMAHCYLGLDHTDTEEHFSYMHPDPMPLPINELKEQFIKDIKSVCRE